MAYATVSDVEVRYGRTLTPSEAAQVTAWIDDLESEIGERIPNLAALVLSGSPSAGTLRSVIYGAIERKLNNPKNLKSSTVAIDDYSRTEQPWIATPAGTVSLTDEEWARILPGSSGDSFTISPYGLSDRVGSWYTTDGWSPL